MSEFLKILSKLTLVVITIIAVGLVGSGLKNRINQDYSGFEGSKPAGPAVSTLIEEHPLKPDVGPVVQNDASKGLPILVLRKSNTLILNEVITDESVAKLQLEAMAMSNLLPKDQEIILVMYTPGGSVTAGLQLIDTLKSLPQKVKTLTLFSASMGFQVVQNMNDRLIVPAGTLMSHMAAGGVEGSFGGNFDVRVNALRRQLQYMDQIDADRMSMSLEAYRKLTHDEYWVGGFEAVQDRAADKEVLARCGEDMSGTNSKDMNTIFGAITVTFSNCPLITGPLGISLGGIKNQDQQEAKDFVSMLYGSTDEFVEQYIITNKYEKVLIHSKK